MPLSTLFPGQRYNPSYEERCRMEDAEDDWDEVRSLDLGTSTNSLFARKLLEIHERLNKQLDMIKEIMERINDYERR